MTENEMRAHVEWDKGNLDGAFVLFCQEANSGITGCMLVVGYFYDVGISVSQDKQMAMYWYKKAYRKGDACAASNIAILYKENERQRLAFKWFERSCKLGDGDSNLELAKLYYGGIGVRRSLLKAKEHFSVAINSNYITEAGREEALLLFKLCDDQLDK